MKLILKMHTNNAAFEDAPCMEVARILHELADRIDQRGYFDAGNDYPLSDVNGNKIGFAGVYEDDQAVPV